MGQTKRIRKKYSTPSHPWERDRILEEKDILREYGLKNKKEIWKYTAKLRSSRNQVKKIIANSKSEQAFKEKKQLLDKLTNNSLIIKDSKIEDVLELKTKDFLERRLQTIVFRKELAGSMKQSRQFIVHGHILIDGKKVTCPSFIVSKDDEKKIDFLQSSSLSKKDHPERTILKKLEKEKKEKIIESPETKTDKKEVSEKKEETPKEEVKEQPKEVKTND